MPDRHGDLCIPAGVGIFCGLAILQDGGFGVLPVFVRRPDVFVRRVRRCLVVRVRS
jgi:hypothetical protein